MKKPYQKPENHNKRWRQIVEPLIPKDGKDRLFVDLGCNAGFYMQKTKELGYNTVGVEKDEDYLGYADKSLNIVKMDINDFEFPANYITFLACVHYHQSEAQIEAIIHKAMYRSAHIVFMGRHRGRTKTNPRKHPLMRKLRKWDVLEETENDHFYGLRVKNRYVFEMDTLELCEQTQRQRLREGHPEFPEAFGEFCKKVINKEPIDYGSTDFVKHLILRKRLYPLGRCWIYEKMVEDIQKNGIREPIIIKNDFVANGHHRLIIAKELGISRVICIRQRVPS